MCPRCDPLKAEQCRWRRCVVIGNDLCSGTPPPPRLLLKSLTIIKSKSFTFIQVFSKMYNDKLLGVHETWHIKSLMVKFITVKFDKPDSATTTLTLKYYIYSYKKILSATRLDCNTFWARSDNVEFQLINILKIFFSYRLN